MFPLRTVRVSIRTISVGVILLLLTACSPLGVISDFLSPSSGPSVDAQVGKTNEQVKGISIKEDTIDAEVVTVTKAEEFASVTATEFIHTERVPFWLWLLMILGWILPSPQEIYRGLINLLKGRV